MHIFHATKSLIKLYANHFRTKDDKIELYVHMYLCFKFTLANVYNATQNWRPFSQQDERCEFYYNVGSVTFFMGGKISGIMFPIGPDTSFHKHFIEIYILTLSKMRNCMLYSTLLLLLISNNLKIWWNTKVCILTVIPVILNRIICILLHLWKRYKILKTYYV